ncbi:SAM-dependent methyltransferase [Massilia sp. YMA4]|uniref:class I SAM-dependent methyltransferase n=1 Tax=Massilia sp. YMA4 TaxID=1593482 RepID=UPI000DD167D0|nr:SAM-dependent methyltransferase [Massilia sp. YMA4]AXA90817.1 SAM-dependent methyltransferase [Massilia sp. YMA4]
MTKNSTFAVAALRALHQLMDEPRIFDDPLALRILGEAGRAEVLRMQAQAADPLSKALRTALAVRSRFAEDEWAGAWQRGVRQHVLLGAGLDTWAYRQPDIGSRIFEVDLPGAQQAKRAALRAAGIEASETVRYVTADFEQDQLDAGLAHAGFDRAAPAFFSWLGVTPYLEDAAVFRTLDFVSRCAPGSAVVFDYIVEPSLLAPLERMGLEMLGAKLAEEGEPLKTFFDPVRLEERLRQRGYRTVANIGPEQLAERYLKHRADGAQAGNVTRLMYALV